MFFYEMNSVKGIRTNVMIDLIHGLIKNILIVNKMLLASLLLQKYDI